MKHDEFTILWNHSLITKNGLKWDIDLEVTFEISQLEDEGGPYLPVVEITHLEAKGADLTDELQIQIEKELLQEDSNFLDVCVEHANAATDPLSDPRIP